MKHQQPLIIAPRGTLLTDEELTAIYEMLEQNESAYESPIEREFGIAAVVVCAPLGWRVIPQFKIGGYRYDFAILHPRLAQILALVECDGKDFHSTPDQIANDQAKIKFAESLGTFVVRYSGAAIFRDAHGCAINLAFTIGAEWKP